MATDYQRDLAVAAWVAAGSPGVFDMGAWSGGLPLAPTPPPVVYPDAAFVVDAPDPWVPAATYGERLQSVGAFAPVGAASPIGEIGIPVDPEWPLSGPTWPYHTGNPYGSQTGVGIPTIPTVPTINVIPGEFIGGRLGRVRYTRIANRQITGVRFGTLPMVVFQSGGGSGEFQP